LTLYVDVGTWRGGFEVEVAPEVGPPGAEPSVDVEGAEVALEEETVVARIDVHRVAAAGFIVADGGEGLVGAELAVVEAEPGGATVDVDLVGEEIFDLGPDAQGVEFRPWGERAGAAEEGGAFEEDEAGEIAVGEGAGGLGEGFGQGGLELEGAAALAPVDVGGKGERGVGDARLELGVDGGKLGGTEAKDRGLGGDVVGLDLVGGDFDEPGADGKRGAAHEGVAGEPEVLQGQPWVIE